jgi:hypothetical protein
MPKRTQALGSPRAKKVSTRVVHVWISTYDCCTDEKLLVGRGQRPYICHSGHTFNADTLRNHKNYNAREEDCDCPVKDCEEIIDMSRKFSREHRMTRGLRKAVKCAQKQNKKLIKSVRYASWL